MRQHIDEVRRRPKTRQQTFAAITPVRAAVCAALYGMSSAAHAQQAGSAQEPAAALQEVTVTATRRTQTLEAVPYSLSVISADRLAETGVTDLASLATAVPGLSMYEYGARLAGATVPIIRGVNATGEPTRGFRTTSSAFSTRTRRAREPGPSPSPELRSTRPRRGACRTASGTSARRPAT